MNAPDIVIVGAHQGVSLDPYQAEYFVRPDLGPNCLQGFQPKTNSAGSRQS